MTNEEAISILEHLIKMLIENNRESDYAKAFRMAIAALRNQPKWIPCSEKIPEYGEEVLTIDGYGEYEINWIIDTEYLQWFTRGPVAWMPLPKPYEGGKE